MNCKMAGAGNGSLQAGLTCVLQWRGAEIEAAHSEHPPAHQAAEQPAGQILACLKLTA